MDRANPPRPNEPTPPQDPKTATPGRDGERQGDGDPNPPRTTGDAPSPPRT